MEHDSAMASSKVPDEVLYKELWHACAGPSSTVPKVGDLVFYFPQGHIEQVEASTNQAADHQLPAFGLPFKILCRVMEVVLKAEPDTEGVFAQVSLFPEPNQDENAVVKKPQPLSLPRSHVHSFCKKLTTSDASIHGTFSVLRQHADECFPPLDMSNNPPTQELIAKDLYGVEWRFGHIFRGQPRRHLLQNGWRAFVASKRLVAEDTFIFLRGENGDFRVGVRRARRLHGTCAVSSHNMHIGVLATAWLAMTNKTSFTLNYFPRASSEFIVPYYQYMGSLRKNPSAGTRFSMRFEGEESSEQRFTGTVVGVEDLDSRRWPESKWRCLKVRWEENYSIPLPERISPWMIEPTSSPPVNPLQTNLIHSPISSGLTHEGSSKTTAGPSKSYGTLKPLSSNDLTNVTYSEAILGLNKRDGVNAFFPTKWGSENWIQMGRPERTCIPANTGNEASPRLNVAAATMTGRGNLTLFGFRINTNPPTSDGDILMDKEAKSWLSLN